MKKAIWHQVSPEDWAARWANHRGQPPLNRSDIDVLQRLAGANERLHQNDLHHVYFPLVHLILQEYQEARKRHHNQDLYVLGISGSVAVGKSTAARVITALLRRAAVQVELVTTDNFLKSNEILEAEQRLHRKGFPESYDETEIQRFLQALHERRPYFQIPTYDHVVYTILPEAYQTIYRPNILILEGVNVLQREDITLNLGLYFDAQEAHIQQWYVQRFLGFRRDAFRVPGAYFEKYADLNDEQATATALDLWNRINGPNLAQYISPSRQRADLIFKKSANHRIEAIQSKQCFQKDSV